MLYALGIASFFSLNILLLITYFSERLLSNSLLFWISPVLCVRLLLIGFVVLLAKRVFCDKNNI